MKMAYGNVVVGTLAVGTALGLPLVGCSSSSSSNNPASDGGGDDTTTSSSGSGSTSSSSSGSSSGSSSSGSSSGSSGSSSSGGEGGAMANTIIADQFNNRVIEITPDGGIVWVFGDGTAVPGPRSVVGPNDCERLPNGQTLISGTGDPASTGPACAAISDAGCLDNRVILVASDGGIAWQYGNDGGLNSPVCARYLDGGNVLITDQGNARIIEVTTQGSVAWQYAPMADGGPALNNPNSAERLANGNTLIADENNNRVVEISSDGGIVWQYPTSQTPAANVPSGVAYASRLESSGHTLITDSNNNRILEVDPTGNLVWQYHTDTRSTSGDAGLVDGGNTTPLPTRAVRLQSGNTLISDQFNHQVIEVDPTGHIVFQYGQLNVLGPDAGLLNAPYDAKRIGDFTGLSRP